jgi:DHA3 family macrolide efflux protein-like MFS transporter
LACIFDGVFTSSWRCFSLPRRIIINFTDGPGKSPCKNHRIKPILKGAINIVAPPFGALLLDALNVLGVLSIDFITTLIAVVILFFIKIPQSDIIED